MLFVDTYKFQYIHKHKKLFTLMNGKLAVDAAVIDNMIVLIIAKILQDKLWDIVMTLRFYFQDTTSFLTYILNHLQRDSLYRQLSRIEIKHSSCVGFVLRMESWLTIFPEQTL